LVIRWVGFSGRGSATLHHLPVDCSFVDGKLSKLGHIQLNGTNLWTLISEYPIYPFILSYVHHSSRSVHFSVAFCYFLVHNCFLLKGKSYPKKKMDFFKPLDFKYLLSVLDHLLFGSWRHSS